MRITEAVKELIDVQGYDWLDESYSDSIPDSVVASTDTTQLLITEVTSTPEDFANNTFTSVYKEVRINIYYKLDFAESVGDVEIAIMKLFTINGWVVSETKPPTTDPSTDQVFSTLDFGKTNSL